MANDLIKTNYSDELARIQPEEIRPLFEKALSSVREEVVDNPYIVEAIRVLQVGGYRSAIGSFWNAVVDDLRNKIIHRSLELFNKATNISLCVRVVVASIEQKSLQFDRAIERL
ncbi:hypothetical protein, partial [Desulfobacula sp.]|uniref:hypothetical protein n=1 Tax=Desulfobacula sp. TaxID=2593537 RepID=UPI0039B9495D